MHEGGQRAETLLQGPPGLSEKRLREFARSQWGEVTRVLWVGLVQRQAAYAEPIGSVVCLRKRSLKSMGRSSWCGFQTWSLLQLRVRPTVSESLQACMCSKATSGGHAITVSSAYAAGTHWGSSCSLCRGSARTNPKVKPLMGSPCGMPEWVTIMVRDPACARMMAVAGRCNHAWCIMPRVG